MKGYSTFPKAPGLEPNHQMQFCVIPRKLVGVGSYCFAEMHSTTQADRVTPQEIDPSNFRKIEHLTYERKLQCRGRLPLPVILLCNQ